MDIDAAIYDVIGQHQVAQYFTQLNSYHVIVEGPPGVQATPAMFNLGLHPVADHREERAPVVLRQGRPERHRQSDDQPPRAVP